MGGSTGDVVNTGLKVAFAPVTGGLSLTKSDKNPIDKSFDPTGNCDLKRQARSAADQQKDSMLAQEADLKKKKNEARNTAANLAIRQRLIAQRGYTSSSNRGGTVLTSPTGATSGNGGPGVKTLLGT